MGELDDAPIVELKDAYGPDDFIAPPPGFDANPQKPSTSNQRNTRQTNPPAIFDEPPPSPTSPHVYVPNHPSQKAPDQLRQKAQAIRKGAMRRTLPYNNNDSNNLSPSPARRPHLSPQGPSNASQNNQTPMQPPAAHSAAVLNPRLIMPVAQPRFGSAPNFTSLLDNGRTQVQTIDWTTQFANQLRQIVPPIAPVAPLPAHNGTSGVRPPVPKAAHSRPVRPNLPNRDNLAMPPRSLLQQGIPAFASAAQQVRPAYEDFLRHVQQLIPNVNIVELGRQLATNPTQPLQIPVPMGSNTQLLQNYLQQAFETVIKDNLTQKANFPPSNQQYPQKPSPQFLASQAYMDNVQPQMPPPPPPRLPTEDEMAKQDQEADIGQDDEYREVETYADYFPAKLKLGNKHPDPVVETSSLATVEPPDITYKLKLPSRVIDDGYLSALQLESVIYASQQHNLILADGKHRRGFLIGDGAGVGKGRTIAGIIYENWLNGRKKAIWLSVSTDLKFDAERDLKDIGAKIPVHFLNKFTYGRRINIDHGIIFTTYAGLVSRSQTIKGPLGSRIGQLIQWVGADFDGPIVFDECHKAKNISMAKKTKQQSKAAEYALEIQNKLPRARVVYASATGASETKHLGYMTRLGIWGENTPYPTFVDFCDAIEKRGVGAMELVAVDLKMRGSYIARQLSFKTTNFEIRIANLDESFIELYDECVDLWAKTLKFFREAMGYLDPKRSKTCWASFWAAHQKFFKYLCIGAKVPTVIDIAKKALEDGKCVVIGLQSTGEAKTNEALEDGEINEFISTARATYESLIDNHFPIPNKFRRIRKQSPASSAAESTEGSSSAVDETFQERNACKYTVKSGIARVELDEEKADRLTKISSTRPISKNQRILNELAEEAKKKKELASRRAIRAKRRALNRKPERKTRIRMPKDDSDDTELSNPLDFTSSDEVLGSTSDSTIIESTDDSDYDEDDNSEEDESIQDLKKDGNSSGATNEKLNTNHSMDDDSDDSDIQITATIKPRKKNPEIIFLSSDDEDSSIDNAQSDDPIIIHGDRLKVLYDELFKTIDIVGPKLPTNTLDDLIDRLGGPNKVAEMTGRKGRIVKDLNGNVSYRQRNETDALENLNIKEKERFMSGKKFIAIISEAASSGISLQADKRVQNQRRRVHITIELPWSADRAIQQFGRTHRSNQVSGPEYVFVISELAGEKRFASIVAKRLESLGALTHGDRRANTDTRDLSQFNIVGRFCKQALEHLCNTVEYGHKFANIKPDYPEARFTRDAQAAFIGAGLAEGTSYFQVEKNATQATHFLNRLLGMKVGIQNALFKLFTDYMDRLITRKKVLGEYDAGILELNFESGKTRCLEPENFFLKISSNEVVKCTLRNIQVERGISWDEAKKLLEDCPTKEDKRNGFYISYNPLTKAKMVYLLLREPDGVDLFRSYKPNVGKASKSDYYSTLTEHANLSKPEEAQDLWNNIYLVTDQKCVHLCFFNSCKRIERKLDCTVGLRHRKYCILSGGILTAWPYIEKSTPEATRKLQIIRLRLDANNRVIGKCCDITC